MKILWLASWYPNRLDPFTGDFIQRHASAVSLLQPLQVIFVSKDVSLKAGSLSVETVSSGSLTEQRAFYHPPGSQLPVFGKLSKALQYLISFRKLLKIYFHKEGRPHLIHVHISMRAGLLALWIKRTMGVPYIITEHWTGFDKKADENIWRKNWIYRRITSLVISNAKLLLPVSDDLGKKMLTLAPNAKYEVIRNVVDTVYFFPEIENLDRPYTFVHASSLNAQKNPEAILTAFGVLRKKNDWRLIIIGPAPDNLRDLAGKLGIQDKLQWMGEISYEEVAKEMRAADCLVMFSRYENLPCVIEEALCCGLPVISSNVGGIAEVVDESNGILVEPDKVEELTKALQNILTDRDRFDRRKISTEAASRFSYHAVAQQIESVYRRFE